MKAKTKFLKWFFKTPVESRSELVNKYWVANPMSLNAIAIEVKGNTEKGRIYLEKLGWKDD